MSILSILRGVTGAALTRDGRQPFRLLERYEQPRGTSLELTALFREPVALVHVPIAFTRVTPALAHGRLALGPAFVPEQPAPALERTVPGRA